MDLYLFGVDSEFLYGLFYIHILAVGDELVHNFKDGFLLRVSHLLLKFDNFGIFPPDIESFFSSNFEIAKDSI